MTRSRRRLLFILCGTAALAAAFVLVWKGIQLTRMLERQAALVFADSAAREARSRLPDLERALRGLEDAALAAILDLPPDPPRDAVARILAAHPIADAPFLIASDGSFTYPSPPGPPLAALAGDETPPEEYLRARRLALDPSHRPDAARALSAVSAAPEIARPWRLRARAALAALELEEGKAAESAATLASIETDFPEELSDAARPSRVQIVALRAFALRGAGDGSGARSLLLGTMADLERSGPVVLGGDDGAILLAKAKALAAGPSARGPDPEASGGPTDFAAAVERFRIAHLAAARSIAFSRSVKEWILPRLSRGGDPEPFIEVSDAERSIVAWARGRPGGGLSAAGFRVRPEAVLDALNRALARDGSGLARPGESGDLPLRAAGDPLPEGFQELAALPGPFGDFRVGLERAAWDRLLGSARRPFLFAQLLVAALAVFIAASAAFGLRALRREMFLARMKTEFVANVSHELKTPLALIRLFGETLLLGRVRDEGKAREYFGIIARESERLTHLVDNILDFAGIEAGRKAFDFRATDLGRVVEETLGAYRFQLEERGFRVSLSIDPDLPPTLADPDGVAQALINLLNNAVKYSPDRKEVAVRAARAEGTVRVSVVDRGIGIAPAERKRVFEDFYRSPAARRLGTRGSGLGLTLVRRIVEAHGGSIELESVPGEGSTFTMVFPIRDAGAAGGGPAGRPEGSGR